MVRIILYFNLLIHKMNYKLTHYKIINLIINNIKLNIIEKYKKGKLSKFIIKINLNKIMIFRIIKKIILYK